MIISAHSVHMVRNAPRYGQGSRAAQARQGRGNAPGYTNGFMPQRTVIAQGDCDGSPHCKIHPGRYFGGPKKAGVGQTNATGGRPSGLRGRMAVGGRGRPRPNYVFKFKTHPGPSPFGFGPHA